MSDGYLYMRTTQEPKRVDVVYRRIDDAYLDPLTFRPDSALGVPGIFDLYRAGRVTLVNAPGTGIADDKSIYTYIPDVIEFYTGEKPLAEERPDVALRRTQVNLPMCSSISRNWWSRKSTVPVVMACWWARHRRRRKSRHSAASSRPAPSNYIAQPTLALSTVPTFTKSGIAPCHVDLRPFVLSGDQIRITPGGLTRVALKKGSLVVNSSQGGGTKDTWVLED